MNIKKIAFLGAFFVFFGRVCFGITTRDDGFDDDFNNISAVQSIKKLDLKKIENNIKREEIDILISINEKLSRNEYEYFYVNYNYFMISYLYTTIEQSLSFCSLIQQSSSLEDLYYNFFLNKKNAQELKLVSSIPIGEYIQNPVNSFLKKIPNHDNLKIFLNTKLLNDFIVPVKNHSTSIFTSLNDSLKSDFPKQRINVLKKSLPKEIKKQKKIIMQKSKSLKDQNSKDFLDDLLEILNSFLLYIKSGQGSLEEVLKKIDFFEKKTYKIHISEQNSSETQEEKYKKIKRDFLVLTSPDLYNFKPSKKPNYSVPIYFRTFGFLSFFSGGTYFFYHFIPKNGMIPSLSQLFWKKFLGYP